MNKNKYKNFLKSKIKIIKYLSEKGYFTKAIRKHRFINFIFQRIIRINSDSNWSVNFTSRVIIPNKIKFGNNVERSFKLSGNSNFQAGNGIEIGDDTIFASGVQIISANHSSSNLDEWEKTSSILIGRKCWLGGNSVILPGVKLGDNVIVGAGPWVKTFWDMMDLPNKISIKNSKGELHDNVPMWQYWYLTEGVLGVEPNFLKTEDGNMPPVIHVDTDAPL